MVTEIKSFLGTGWTFPPTFDKLSFSNAMSSNETDIHESLLIILSTTPGERLMQPEFGCDLKRLVFEKIDSSLINNLNDIIYYALLRFEPRINFESVEILNRNELDGILHIVVNYSIIITNTRHNIVFPFYLLEGTNVID